MPREDGEGKSLPKLLRGGNGVHLPPLTDGRTEKKQCAKEGKKARGTKKVIHFPPSPSRYSPILSWNLLNECLLISSSLTLISMAKSTRSQR